MVVDDEQSICWGLTRLGESLGHEVIAASSAEQAFEQAERTVPDVVILDVRLPGMDGLAALDRFQSRMASVPVIMITAYGDLQIAVDAVRRGAFDYIAKPFDTSKVQRALSRALASRLSESALTPPPLEVEGMVGRSPAMQEVYKRIALAAGSDAPVLVGGESGTGKELAARAIHRYSQRSEGPFVAVNVASLSPTLAESELFGHVRGAFTGAESSRRGLLAQADGGTLFLDEVADIPLPTQVKLLRALEHGEVVPVGGNEPQKADFRVISATHRNLLERVAAGEFRHDLYFRLCAFPIDLPPLRDRAEDIADLAEFFASILSKPAGHAHVSISNEALVEMKRRRWRGNVRELRNAIEHAMILARGRAIMPEHLPAEVEVVGPDEEESGLGENVIAAVRRWVQQNLDDPALSGAAYQRLLEVIEPPLLEAALAKHRGQCASAARMLGMHRTTLRKKLTYYKIDGTPDA
jgi:two-component system nitrogen regulation response regulator GlnG